MFCNRFKFTQILSLAEIIIETEESHKIPHANQKA